MNKNELDFISLMRRAITGREPSESFAFNADGVFALASAHNCLPLVYAQAVKTKTDVSRYKRASILLTGNQIRLNSLFEQLYDEMSALFGDIIVLKGPVCAALYPQPDLRLCSDFDIVVPEQKYSQAADYLTDNGFERKGGAFHNKSTGLYIEMSDSLCGKGENALPSLESGRTLEKCGRYLTLAPTFCYTYLIYHAFRHFTASGFGVRQLADIALYSDYYKDEIDFESSLNMLGEINAAGFAANTAFAAEKLFGIKTPSEHFGAHSQYLCPSEFIADIISAGIFGKSSEDRLHSAVLVKNAVSGKSSGALSAVFLPLSQMRAKYALLERAPFLLPLFWIVRLAEYVFRAIFKKEKLSASNTVKIAEDRIAMLRKMGVIADGRRRSRDSKRHK